MCINNINNELENNIKTTEIDWKEKWPLYWNMSVYILMIDASRNKISSE